MMKSISGGFAQPGSAQSSGHTRNSSLYVTAVGARKLTQSGEAKVPELAAEPDETMLNERGYAAAMWGPTDSWASSFRESFHLLDVG
jgi:hypothetical protein